MKPDRRAFVKTLASGSVWMAAGLTVPKILAQDDQQALINSEEQYGKLPVLKLKNGKLPYETDPAIYKRMNEKFTIFSRNVWDPLRQNRPEMSENLMMKHLKEEKGQVPDYTRLDYALMAASWSIAQMRNSPCYEWESTSGMVRGMTRMSEEPWIPDHNQMTPEEASLALKHASLFFGASQAGVAQLNPAWLYSNVYAPTRDDRERTIPLIYGGDRYEKTGDAWYIPEAMNKVLVLIFEEDYEAIMNSPGKLASAATGDGYSRMAATSFRVAEFIRALGYRALPAGNGLGLSIPMAIDAGLGELGRNGLLVTPKYGPRVRISKIVTDMPLVPDQPIRFGVTEFCETCMVCAMECPSGSIPKTDRSWDPVTPSNNPGVKKWYVQQETCYDFNGFSCSSCKRNCPFNKPNNEWTHELIRGAIKLKVKPLNKAMTSLDQASGYGEQLPAREFWKKDGSKKITSREKM